ncbi:MAG: transposase [Rhodopirellula sp.]|nr:transposase [Rhodopirellula sp.]
MEITDPKTGTTLAIRRITVELYQPTRDGDTEIHILTNVPQSAANALKLADLYRKRWTIETMFQELTETLTCEIKTLGYPKAAVFAFCLALVAYNGISVIKAALRSVHGTDKVEEHVSGYYLSLEISKTYTGMMIAIPPGHRLSAAGHRPRISLSSAASRRRGATAKSPRLKNTLRPAARPPRSSLAVNTNTIAARVAARW